MEMGFDEKKVRAALDKAKGDLNQATDILLSSMWVKAKIKKKIWENKSQAQKLKL